jgi:hypothetical protein
MRTLGRRIGIFYSIYSFAALFGSPIGGALVAKDHGEYLGLQIFASVMTVMGTCVIVGARMCVSRRRLWVKA